MRHVPDVSSTPPPNPTSSATFPSSPTQIPSNPTSELEIITGQEFPASPVPLTPSPPPPPSTPADLPCPTVIAWGRPQTLLPLSTLSTTHSHTLPLTAVQLQMRQRELCFDAAPNATYALRYGDNDLRRLRL